MMFIINSNAATPAILSMTMGGDSLSVMIGSDISIPSGIAVDIILNRVFWTDRGQKIIESSLPDGSDRTIHVTDGMFYALYSNGLYIHIYSTYLLTLMPVSVQAGSLSASGCPLRVHPELDEASRRHHRVGT